MSTPRNPVSNRLSLGLRAGKGGAVVVGLVLEANQPRVVFATHLATGAPGDPLALEPYHVAAQVPRGPKGEASAHAAAAVAEGRRRQEQLAAQGLEALILRHKDPATGPVMLSLLVNRAGWITDLLSYSLAWEEHVPVAEGLAVRDALRFACTHLGVECIEVDEKSLQQSAPQVLALSAAQLDAQLKSLGTTVGRPWRKEQKLACLAAWLRLAAPVAHRP
jgi:hypothetical protein